MRARSVLAVVLAVLPSLVVGQINLRNFSARDTRSPVFLGVSVDSLSVESRVGSGLATTVVTMVLTPHACYDFSGQADSIELSTSFSLPDDFVAKNMWLWVNGEPVTAYIQDRALADAQYTSIVGARRDPAILSSWGYGSFELRVFPTSLEIPRRVAIEFQHAFDDDTLDQIRAHLPVVLDSSYSYYCGVSGVLPNLLYASVTVRTVDTRTYAVSVPGLGEARCSPGIPASLKGRNLKQLGPGRIVADDLSGRAEFLWSGRDKDSRMTAGFVAEISESTVTLDPQPDTRIIVLDMRSQYWDWDIYYDQYYSGTGYMNPDPDTNPTIDMWARAQKLAVMALQNYVDGTKKFNLVIAGAQPRTLFNSPVSGNDEHLRRAYQAILDAAPDPLASTAPALEAALAQAQKAAVVLVSDLYRPYYYYYYLSDSTGAVAASQDQVKYDSAIAAVGRAVAASDDILFTICDDWQLEDIARSTGGFNLASLRYDYYVTYEYADVSGTRAVAQLPDLFGGGGYWRSSRIRSVSVEGLSDVVYTTDNYWGYYPVMRVDAAAVFKTPAPRAMAKASDFYYPWFQSSLTLRLAGIVDRTFRSRQVVATVTGTMNGLSFTQRIAGTPSLTGLDTGAVEWAHTKAGMLAQSDWWSNAAAIKAVGKDYHIVTRQTSLLALEPGMALWEDTAAQVEQRMASVDMAAVSPFNSMLYPGYSDSVSTYLSLDNVSIEDLINQVASVQSPARAVGAARSTARMVGGRIDIRLGSAVGGAVRAELFDMQGRLVDTQVWSAETGRQAFTWQPGSGSGRLSSGRYTLRLKAGNDVQVFRVAAGL